ncbi:hypothetical protein PR202_gb23168 [Eleusine coracana subsp. coracana]|uniref:Uncharacterized protein n=1 Tax=Eleusine coracana subsp. coracana TaxID=191504 RepID=A0AAV5FHY4_ELECO|nr:hypothetical protein PR202_gb23168 [Eleusine coracana subsp. coracana]
MEKIIELTAWTEENYGKKFWKCPRYAPKVSNGCKCFMWLSGYVKLLKQVGLVADEDAYEIGVKVKRPEPIAGTI